MTAIPDRSGDCEPVWQSRPADTPEAWSYTLVRCRCGWTTEECDATAEYAKHLELLGAPSHLVTYWRDWACYVEEPQGSISREAVAQELQDFTDMMRNTDEASEARQRMAAEYADDLVDVASDFYGSPSATWVAQVLCGLAEEWAPGAVERNQERSTRSKHHDARFQEGPHGPTIEHPNPDLHPTALRAPGSPPVGRRPSRPEPHPADPDSVTGLPDVHPARGVAPVDRP